MRIIAAPDSFKGSLTASEAANAIANGWKSVRPQDDLILLPMADGGEGSVQSLVDATGGTLYSTPVHGPLGNEVNALWGLLGDGVTGVIEVAQAVGLPLVPMGQRDPMETGSLGVGELISAALDEGIRRFIVCLGGSATVDGGVGLLIALGATLNTPWGSSIKPCGEGLLQLDSLDLSTLDPRVLESEFLVAVDVDNPLLGPNGAAMVYGPQKGASLSQITQLEQGLQRLTRFMKDPMAASLPGAGAAGGMGAAFAAFLGGKLQPGFDLIATEAALEVELRRSQLVITGEGRIDRQTLSGKTPMGVARWAKQYHLPVIALAGELGEGWELLLEHGIDSCFSIAQGPACLEECCEEGVQNLTKTASQLARLIQIGAQP